MCVSLQASINLAVMQGVWSKLCQWLKNFQVSQVGGSCTLNFSKGLSTCDGKRRFWKVEFQVGLLFMVGVSYNYLS